MLTLEEARAHILESLSPLAATTLAIDDALGCVVAKAVMAETPVPLFANSAMDGYALHAADTEGAPVRLKVVGTARAGSGSDTSVGRGEAIRIMTGAPIPALADAVCVLEKTRLEGAGETVVVIECPVAAGANVRLAGEDVRAGQEIIGAGTDLTPAHLGLLASVGRERVEVHGRPRVGVLSTGDELAEDGTGTLRADKIHDANRPILLALCRQAGFTAVDLGIVGDDEGEITHRLQAGASCCDALVTTGGVSVGDTDLLKVVLEKLSAGGAASMSAGGAASMSVAVRPARHVAYAILSATGTPVFGLSGNPAAAVVGYELFARPALRRLAGHHRLDRPVVTALAEVAFARRPDGRLHVVRVKASMSSDGVVRVGPSGAQDSHMLFSLAEANAFALLPDGDGVEEGGRVDVMLLDESCMAAAR